jgi:hypothetical protein
MSLFTDSSLCLVPSGVKDGKLYSVKPIDGTGDLTFSRGSDIEATRVAANGYIEKAQVNLAIWSEDASNATYSKTNVTVTANSTTAPDGTLSADTLTATGVGGTLQGVVTVNAGSVYSVSVYLKRKTGTGQIGLRGISNVVTNVTITNEWQRYETYMTAADIYGRYGVYLATSGDEVYCWGFQINYGTIAQTYLPTTTTSVVAGITNDMPRLDYSGGASCPSLKLEPSRSNLIPHSEYIDDSGWTKSNATITTNSATSAEGVQNASLVTFGSGGYILESVTTTKTIGSTETISVFSNADISGTFLKYGGGTAAGTDVEGREVIGNGWFRYYVTRTFTEAETGSTQLLIAQSDVGDSVLIYGAQLEAGSYSSSYIPTYGTSATRTAETAYKTGISSLIGQTAGTIYIEVNTNQHISELSDDTSANRIVFYTDGSDYLRNLIRASGSTSSNIQTNTTIQAGDKIALAYANNDSVIYKNGVQIGSDTSVTIPATSKVNVGSDYNESLNTTNSVNQVLLFKTRLSNSDLATLTSL